MPEASPVSAGRLETLPVGKSRVVLVDGKKVAVFHTEDGVYAFQNECPHAYMSLSQGSVRDGVIICPLHGWTFDVRDGSARRAPPGADLRCYPVRIVDGEIQVEQSGCRPES